ncbi:hypothetical protein NDU88_008289 [Pleurodeles waltl]|uniref:Uncharacterized protein n=1 Tax=Pleurodeles waltl TaxID=8319 RepID=A0AAV7QN75_PLEWA|nr:hypothetical protein NDU88_008289 [Pleurodeles waltl]
MYNLRSVDVQMTRTLSRDRPSDTKDVGSKTETGQSQRTSLQGKIDTVVAEVNILRMEHRKLADRVTTAETTLETAQPDIEEMKLRLQHQESEIHYCTSTQTKQKAVLDVIM